MKTKTTIKYVAFILLALSMIFARSLSAQNNLVVMGNVSDVNNVPVANHAVNITVVTPGTIGFTTSILTDINGDFIGTINMSNTSTVSTIEVSTADCNGNMLVNTHTWTPNFTTIVSNFVYCAGGNTTPCTLYGITVSQTPNGLSVTNITMPPFSSFFISWSNGTTGYWSAYYPNWCVHILDTLSGCDTIICDTIGSTWPCTLSGISVTLDSTTNILEATWDPNYTYYWTNGSNYQHTQYYPNWCVHVEDSVSGCDTVICETNVNPSPCQASFYWGYGWQPNTIEFYDYSYGGNITSWHWDFGDGTTSNQQNPIHAYQNTSSGFYMVCLTITSYNPNGTNSCTSTYCDSIFIQNMSNCNASFYAINLGSNTAQFTNNSWPMGGGVFGPIVEFDLDYGDGNIDYSFVGNPIHTYANAGTYYACITMSVVDSSGNVICTDTYCDSIAVTSGATPCYAEFTFYNDSVCIVNPNGTVSYSGPGNIFHFFDLSTPVGMIATWSWDMGDFGAGTYLQGTSSSSQHPIYEYDTAGTYYACLTITTTPITGGQSCSSTYCDTMVAMAAMQNTGIEAVDIVKELKTYPNPASNTINTELYTTIACEIELSVVNVIGQHLIHQMVHSSGGAEKIATDISDLPAGVYTLEIKVNNSSLYQRIVKSR